MKAKIAKADRDLLAQAEHRARLVFAGASVRFVMSVKKQAKGTGRVTDAQREVLERIAGGNVWRRYEDAEKAQWTKKDPK